MQALRAFLRDHRHLTAMLVALALCMKILVPAGTMIGPSAKILSFEICADSSGGHLTRQVAVPVAPKGNGSTDEHGKTGSACPWSGLSMAALGGADAPLLALVLAFIMALGVVAVLPAPTAHTSHLRPPLRGPPALA